MLLGTLVKQTIGLGLILSCVSGCVTSTPEGSFCMLYTPICHSDKDTDSTRLQIDHNNYRYEYHCPKLADAFDCHGFTNIDIDTM